jgi:hypothetical protein
VSFSRAFVLTSAPLGMPRTGQIDAVEFIQGTRRLYSVEELCGVADDDLLALFNEAGRHPTAGTSGSVDCADGVLNLVQLCNFIWAWESKRSLEAGDYFCSAVQSAEGAGGGNATRASRARSVRAGLRGGTARLTQVGTIHCAPHTAPPLRVRRVSRGEQSTPMRALDKDSSAPWDLPCAIWPCAVTMHDALCTPVAGHAVDMLVSPPVPPYPRERCL